MRNALLASAVTAVILGCACINVPAYGQEQQSRKTEVHIEGATSVLIEAVAGSRFRVLDPAALQPNSAAPALSKIFINNVCSATACENVSQGQIATTATYTGSPVYVYVWEIGYGNNEIATQGGAPVASSYLVGEQSVCISGGYYVTPCAIGSTVAGWRYEWNVGYYLSNNYAQNFTAQDTSTNYPYNTISTGIRINYTH